mmetsp:Transcript_22976/g.35408  ORF Transcript_22976/g.35408 Transcript_22976/m.35408 type:complete len:259 (+) Transcript_22976:781-1557(+)
MMVCRDASHIIMHSRQDRNGLLGHIHTSKNGCSLTNSWQTFFEQLRRQMIQMQVDMILVWSHTPPFTNLHGHGSRHHITTGQILGTGSIPLHEPLTFTVAQNTALTTTSLGNQTSGPVDTGGMKLHKLRILIGQTGPHGHGIPVSCTSMCACAAEVGSTVPSRGQYSVFGMDPMEGPILHIQRRDTRTDALIVHHQIHGKVFDEVRSIKRQRSAIQSMQHGMTGTVGRTGTPIRLTAFPKVQTLPTKGSLINLAILCA